MRALLNFVFVIAGTYAVICVLVFFFQKRLLFFPDKTIVTTPAIAGLPFDSVELTTEDGLKIDGWFIPATNEKAVLLFLHGNAGNMSHRLESIQLFNDLGLSVLIIDYRGYGRSEGQPTEEGTYLDAMAAWHFLRAEKEYPASKIILFGRSLGGAVAAGIARDVAPGILILESTFISVPELASDIYWFLPIRFLARIGYNNAEALQDISCPVLIIHSKDDEIIPFKHGRKLFELAKAPKSFLEIRFGHNEGFYRSGPQYLNGIEDFLQRYLK